MKKNIVKLTGCMLLAVAALFGYSTTKQNTNTSTHAPALQEQYSQLLAQKEATLWELITTQTGITKTECHLLADQQRLQFTETIKKKADGQEPVSKEITDYIHGHLRSWNISPETIIILPSNNPDSCASASIDAMFVNQTAFNAYTSEVKAYLIGHETVHIVHNDPGIQHAFITKLKEKQILEQSGELVNKLSKFCEERADTLSFTKGMEHISGGLSLLNELRSTHGDDQTAPSHPSLKERIAMAENVRHSLGSSNAKLA